MPSSDVAELDNSVDLENTPEFQALVIAAAGKPERAMGDSVIPAEPPHWPGVLAQAQNLIKDPPHLSPLVYAVKASSHVRGFSGLDEALSQVAEALESHWDAVQPLADPDDPDDPFYARVNILRELSDDPAFTHMLYRLPMVDVRGVGTFSARDVDISKGIVNGSEEELARCKDGLIKGAMQETGGEALRELANAMAAAQATCARIEALFEQNAGSAHGLSMDSLRSRLSGCHVLLAEMSGDLLAETELAPLDAQSSNEPVLAEAATSSNDADSPQPTNIPSRLTSREEVLGSFDQIIAYYKRVEPSSPVPILAFRAREMVPKNFFEILQELAPNGKDSFTSCLESLSDRPMASLLDDSYQRFLAGAQTNETSDPNLMHSGSPPNASIDSRSKVVDALNDIEMFFTQTEPASPIPLMVAEMKKMVQKTFTQLVAEFCQSLRVNAVPATEAPTEESSG